MKGYIGQLLLRKARTLFLMVLALPVVFLVRLLRPLAVVRIGSLISRRIGHFMNNTDVYLCERDAGMHPPRTFDIFYHHLPISNYQVKKMWERTGKLRISPFTRFTHTLDRLNRLLPGGKRHTILTSALDFYGIRARTKPYLSFTPREEHLGREGLQKLGISESNFVCFHARDSAYLDTVLQDHNWRYHDFRDSSIHNYIPAAEELVRRGYFMVRMGAKVKEPLRVRNPKIIDYAVKGRTDFLDIYMGAKCGFFICDGSGIGGIPEAFRRPIVWVNFVQLEYIPIWGVQDLFIPKKLWLGKERRFLTFSEIINLDLEIFEQYEQLGIEPVENTPEEIAAVALEMDERLKGAHKTTEEDEELQRRFWLFYKARWPRRKILSRIGAEFLRQNQELLN